METWKNGRIFILILLLLIFIPSLLSCNRRQPEKKLKNRANVIRKIGKSPAELEETGEPEHPYGKPFKGVLLWENDPRFKKTMARLRLSVRMAAFQTTLPDPLPGEESNVALAADYLAGSIVRPGEVFSMNRSIGPYSKARGFQEGPAYYGPKVVKVTGGGVCKIASTLYNVVTLANLKVVERNSHSMPVPYVPPGQDATVSSSQKDFKFRNDSDAPVLVWADTKGNTLYMGVYGRNKPPVVNWHHKLLSQKPFQTFYQSNKALKAGQERVVVKGADGVVVHSWLTIKYPNGQSEERDLGVDRYDPLPRVVERG